METLSKKELETLVRKDPQRHALDHMICDLYSGLGGQEAYILEDPEKHEKEHCRLIRHGIYRVKSREYGTLPPEWENILSDDLLRMLKKNKDASEALYNTFYYKHKGQKWKHWKINGNSDHDRDETKKACEKLAQKCLGGYWLVLT